ncbi:MAG: hypothetical protein SGI92_09525 [Bryobacteraceae bacterium]|nr:hypothetical protein [Bryobacteraceae bacterium]
MSFLDNLESSLKSLEGNQERENTHEQRQRQQDEKSWAMLIAPNAEALKKSPFVNDLLMHAVRIGHGLRVKVNMAWMGSTLRLDAREVRLELRPTPTGVEAVFSESGAEQAAEPLDLQSASAEALAQRWLAGLRAD